MLPPTNQTENEEVVKRPAHERKDAEVPKGEGDESFYYELEAALEEDWKVEQNEPAEEKEQAAPSDAEVARRRLAAKARAEEHWKEKRAIRRLEKIDKKENKYVVCNEEEEEECLETFSYDDLHKAYVSD